MSPLLLSLALAVPPAAADDHSAVPAGAASSSAAPSNSVSVDTTAGPLTVHPVMHGTARITVGERTIWLDPWSKADLSSAPTADILLLTDIHPDHLDAAAIEKVHGGGTVVVAPQAVVAAWEGGQVDHVMANGDTVDLGDGLKVTATPMYNHHRGPEEGKLFHDKGRGNGYLLEVGGARVYISGDTACIDEMKALQDIDLAMVTMNLPYTMPPEEAAECVAAFKPKKAVPFHYRGSDLSVFEEKLADVDGVEVVRLEWYPGGEG